MKVEKVIKHKERKLTVKRIIVSGIFVILPLLVCASYTYANQVLIEWRKYLANPVLVAGPSGSWDDNGVNVQCIIKEGDTYKMWYVGGETEQEIEGRIGYATSSDATHWTKYSGNPVFEPGSSGSWDSSGIEAVWVIKDGDIYKMWYTGFQETVIGGIGYATSNDGTNWTKHEGNPVLGPGPHGSWESAWISDPIVIKDGATYKMWYTAGAGSVGGIGYAISNDGISWTKYSGNPVLGPGPHGSWESDGVECNSVIEEEGLYEMWYGGDGSGEEIGSIGYATSNDGVTWIRYGGNPVLVPDKAWEGNNVWNGIVLKDNGIYKMWYSGNAGIGYAVSGIVDVCEGDFDHDGDVDGSDLAVFAADFGRTDCNDN